MIDPQTGYETDLTCECRACAKCDGEGVLPIYEPLFGSVDHTAVLANVDTGESRSCPDCRGTGRYTGDCCVPNHDREDGWEAAELGRILAEALERVA